MWRSVRSRSCQWLPELQSASRSSCTQTLVRAVATERVLNIFNQNVKKKQRDRAAADPNSHDYQYLRSEIASRLTNRLHDILGRSFSNVLELGCHSEHVLNHLQEFTGINEVVQLYTSEAELERDSHQKRDYKMRVQRLVGSAEALPFPEHSFDLVISNLSLHWNNDLVGALSQVKRVLKPDGAFIASLFGEESLFELRTAFLVAEQEREGGISNHVSPFAAVSDAGNLLSRVQFALPTVDQETVEVSYADPFVLMRDLRGMGEGNAQHSRRPYVPRDTFYAMAAAYKAMYGSPDGSVPATFQIVYMIGWAPHATQQQPKERGSAEISLKEFGDKVGEFGAA